MARRITIRFKDGSKYPSVTYEEQRRSVAVRSEGAFAVVTDGYDHEHWYPAADIECIDTEPQPQGW